MTTHSNGMSALQLEAQLGVTYKTAWLLTQKLRRSMIDPNRDLLEGVVEVDQTRFRSGLATRSRAQQREENSDCRSDRGHRARHQQAEAPAQGREVPRHALGSPRLAVIADNSAASLEAFVRANVKPGATLITDGHASYPGLAGDYRHDPRVVGVMAANIVLPWSHRAFALMKRWALGTYHGLRRKHVDAYLDEFVFRYNRRFYRHVSFETMLGLAANHAPTSYRDIIGRERPRKSDRQRRRATTCR